MDSEGDYQRGAAVSDAEGSAERADLLSGAAMTTNLRERTGRIRSALRDAASGPLFAAADVLAIAKEWDALRVSDADAAQFETFGEWLRARLSHPEAWWRVRAEAATRLTSLGSPSPSRSSLQCWDHTAAVWACGRIGLNDAQLEELHRAVVKEWLANNRLPLSYDQVRLLAQKLLGNVTACGPRQQKGCPKCERLEAILSGNPALESLLREAGWG